MYLQHNISALLSTVVQVYSFPGDSDTDTGQPVGPFAVVGSNVIVQDENGEAGGLLEIVKLWRCGITTLVCRQEGAGPALPLGHC